VKRILFADKATTAKYAFPKTAIDMFCHQLLDSKQSTKVFANTGYLLSFQFGSAHA